MIGDREVTMQDTVGYNDTERKFTNKEIKDWARASLIESGSDSVKFILTASLGSDSADLKKSFEMLANTYSKETRDSTIVLLTKSNMANQFLEKRLAQAQKDCNDLGLTYMRFETDYLDNELDREKREIQNKQLLEVADKVKPYKISELTDHLERINKDAASRHAALPNREINCVLKKRKIGESTKAGEGALAGMAAGAPFGPVGWIAGPLIGLIAGLSNSESKYESY